ncbi:MAG: TRAP transporter large permease subunit [Clostridiales bacterium]|nr:TRAP transporter large permease subunit [Clostridiales bacterium]
MKIFVLCMFILTYVLIIAFTSKKALITGIIALVLSVACLISKDLSFAGLFSSIKYDVLLMLLGIMITVGLFTESGMPNMLAEKMVGKIHNSLFALVLLSLVSGIVSAFVDNVATVLMLAPIGLAVAKKIDVSPIPVIISIAVSSNLQGAATLVGDTTSIMLADALGMSFFDFFFWNGKFSIFWAVELGMVATIPILIFIFRKNNKKLLYVPEKIEVKSVVPTVLLLLNLICLALTSLLPKGIEIPAIDLVTGANTTINITNGVICMSFGIIGLIHFAIKNKGQKGQVAKTVKSAVDYQTILFLLFLFVIIACVTSVGIISDIGNFFKNIGSSNVFLLYTLIVFVSVILSAFIDNIPYVATMLPVIAAVTASPEMASYAPVLCFGLLIGATLGGNLTPFGASANVVGIGILEKEGYKAKMSDFFKIGIPFTLVAVLSGYLYCWFVWA